MIAHSNTIMVIKLANLVSTLLEDTYFNCKVNLNCLWADYWESQCPRLHAPTLLVTVYRHAQTPTARPASARATPIASVAWCPLPMGSSTAGCGGKPAHEATPLAMVLHPNDDRQASSHLFPCFLINPVHRPPMQCIFMTLVVHPIRFSAMIACAVSATWYVPRSLPIRVLVLSWHAVQMMMMINYAVLQSLLT